MNRKLGLWLANGDPGQSIDNMLGWGPDMVVSFFDYLQVNRVYQYKAANPDIQVVIRFQHNQSWMQDLVGDATRKAQEIISKWPEIKDLDPYVYFCNENNLHYENGDQDPANQWLYEVQEFYELYSVWVRLQANIIKNAIPEMKLVCPPFAYGHNEDGEPVSGVPKIGWAGYDYLADTIHEFFDDTLTFHGYWHESRLAELYDPELSSWYAYRWRKVLDLFEVTYGNPNCKIIIDECGNFQANAPTFTQQLLDYGSQCLRDNRVLGVTPFLWTDPTNSPGNLPNSWWQPNSEFGMDDVQLQKHLLALAEFLVPTTPPIEPPEPEPDCDCVPDLELMSNKLAEIDNLLFGIDAKVGVIDEQCPD